MVKTIFYLGATGFLSGDILPQLARDFPNDTVRALVRNPTPERVAKLQGLHPGLVVVEGDLNDAKVIVEEASKADIVVNSASSDHWPSVCATLEGLEKNSAGRPGNPPLYLHVSGCGIISNNTRGEKTENPEFWTDIGLDLDDCDPTNTHLESDKPAIAAGKRKNNSIRSIIVYPGQIYGVGNGVQKVTLWLRIFMDYAKRVGYGGTWGRGFNAQNTIHVKDLADAILMILRAASEGKAGEGADGLYFAVTPTLLSYGEWVKAMGDHLYNKGITKEPGAKPMPEEIVEPLGHYGWSLLGGSMFAKADRLTRMGWKSVESDRISLMESLPAMIDAALEDDKPYVHIS
ncbi:uncharacterized protein PHACADRAFT_125329 [Phanerochaete carnosa HHB-10118-sp]|uniref:NAD(P)-binding domain-containing protein n=1 Tax=Phanerochaete carnosa (strain HHB-10118-sp) TaxID=650164 RepID=K5W3N3_PHACS|nr:uncharacterized protein PHACADRAFT_125329 [Phanerochaete carnosa HHB-10118-sp]EKM53534.1 hypothetical protein PHACADRAFT_125329 [Phanerochaete carnosa HHB-10118-sp]